MLALAETYSLSCWSGTFVSWRFALLGLISEQPFIKMSLDLSSAANQQAERLQQGSIGWSRVAGRLLHTQTDILPGDLTVTSGQNGAVWSQTLNLLFFMCNSSRFVTSGASSWVKALWMCFETNKWGYFWKETQLFGLNSDNKEIVNHMAVLWRCVFCRKVVSHQSFDRWSLGSQIIGTTILLLLLSASSSFSFWSEAGLSPKGDVTVKKKKTPNTNTYVDKQQETQGDVQRLHGQMKSCRRWAWGCSPSHHPTSSSPPTPSSERSSLKSSVKLSGRVSVVLPRHTDPSGQGAGEGCTGQRQGARTPLSLCLCVCVCACPHACRDISVQGLGVQAAGIIVFIWSDYSGGWNE